MSHAATSHHNINVEEDHPLLLRPMQRCSVNPRRRWLGRLLIAASVVSTAMWVLDAIFIPQLLRGVTYTPRDSLLDLLVFDCLRFVSLIGYILTAIPESREWWDRHTSLTYYFLQLNIILGFVSFSKLWVYRGWTRRPQLFPMTLGGNATLTSSKFDPSLLKNPDLWWMSPITMVLTIASVLITIVCLRGIHRLDYPPKKCLQAAGLKAILKPYFLPKGCLDKFIVISTFAVVVAAKFAHILSPMMMARAIDKLSQNPPEFPLEEILLFGLLSLLPTGLEQVQEVMSARIWRIAFFEVADHTFAHIHSLSLEWHLKKRMGNVIRAMDRGMNAAESFVGWVVLYLAPTFAQAVVTFVLFVFHFNQPVVAAVTCFFLAWYCWMTYTITTRKTHYNEAMNNEDNEMHEKATDSLVNFETVKYFTTEDIERQSYLHSVHRFKEFADHGVHKTAALNLLQQTVIGVCTVCALLITANAVMEGSDASGNVTTTTAAPVRAVLRMFGIQESAPEIVEDSGSSRTGVFVAVNLYLVQLFAPLAYLGSLFGWIMQSVIDMENLADVLSDKPDVVDKPDAKVLEAPALVCTLDPNRKRKSTSSSPTEVHEADFGTTDGMSIEFRNVSFRYPAQMTGQGLRNVSFKVAPGTTTAIVGHTGSCKTTISRLLFRFYDPQQGEILINGQNIADVTQRSLRQCLGIVPQDTVLFNDTIEHNLSYGTPGVPLSLLEEVAAKAQILDFINRLDKKWKTPVGERGLKLSGGEKQRIAIARCLLKNPPIIVLDEATSALDNKTEKEIKVAVGLLLAGRTRIIIAHRLTTIQNAEQIIVLKCGEVVERGTHEELLAMDGEYAAMWTAQRREPTDSSIANNGSITSTPVMSRPSSPLTGKPTFVHPELEEDEPEEDYGPTPVRRQAKFITDQAF